MSSTSAGFQALTMWRRLLGLVFRPSTRFCDLIDGLPVRRGPRAPLLAVDRPQVAVLVGPLVPDLAAVVLQVLHIGVAAQEPQQLDDDRAQVQLLGGQDREALGQVKADLPAEHPQRAGAGAVAALDAVLQDVGEQVQVLPLGMVGGGLFGVDGRDGVHDPRVGQNRPFIQCGAAAHPQVTTTCPAPFRSGLSHTTSDGCHPGSSSGFRRTCPG
jgi:hypothetical protein